MGTHSQAGVGSLTSLGLGFPICNVEWSTFHKVVGRIKHSPTGKAEAGASEVLHHPQHFLFPYLLLGIQALILLHPQCEELLFVCLFAFFNCVLIFSFKYTRTESEELWGSWWKEPCGFQ